MSFASSVHERYEDHQQQLPVRSTHLDLVFRSSEDVSSPALNLTTRSSFQHEQHIGATGNSNAPASDYLLPLILHGGWESEKFCEYPQELVFRVNRGIPTRIDHLHILSHHCKIASRVEVFTSSSSLATKNHNDWGDGNFAHDFQRLGFVSFQSNESTDFASRELKIVHLQPQNRKITLIRLVLHRCHENKYNLFQQVGLLSVTALTQQQDSNSSSQSWSPLRGGGVLPSLHPSRAEDEPSSDHLFSASVSPLRAKYATKVSPDRRFPANHFTSAPALVSESHGGSKEYEVWIPELREFQTPLQISTRVRLGRELSASATTAITNLWRSLDLECRHLLNKLAILQRTYNDTKHLMGVDDRVAMHEEIDLVVHDFGSLASKAFNLELDQLRHNERQHINKPQASLFQIFPDLKPQNLESISCEAREDLVWKLVEYLRARDSLSTQHEEAMEVVKQLLRDPHIQVFIAACSLLQLLLTTTDQSQEPATLKNQLIEILNVLLQRLDDRQAIVRNNAAFSILKIAELTRTKGTFVMHFILKQLEASRKQQRHLVVSDQVLHAVLKLFSALLLSFHCCASIDIAPRRVLKLLLRSDAAMHASPHIRDAAKQLTLVMYNEVGPEIMRGYLTKLPPEVQEMYEAQFRINDGKKARKAMGAGTDNESSDS